jgi:hypothetical protein
VPLKDARPSGRSAMSQTASSDRNTESVQVPVAATWLWFLTVQDRLIGWPERTAVGTTTSVTTRSDGGGCSMTIGTSLVRSLLRSFDSKTSPFWP